jgi:hypothetical protein
MNKYPKITVRRRHLLGLAVAGVAATAASSVVFDREAIKSQNPENKRKARYQANALEVQNFYRVNSYPRP